jgi:hypothetical protein
LEALLGNSPKQEQNVNIFTGAVVLELQKRLDTFGLLAFRTARRKRKFIGRLDPISIRMKLLRVAETPQQRQADETTQQRKFHLEKDRTTTATSRATRRRKCIGRLDPNSLRLRLLGVAETPQQRQADETTQQREFRLDKDRTTTATSRATGKWNCIGPLDPNSLRMRFLRVPETPEQRQADETTQQREFRLERDRTATATSRATRKRKCIGRLDPNSLRLRFLRVAETPQQGQEAGMTEQKEFRLEKDRTTTATSRATRKRKCIGRLDRISLRLRFLRVAETPQQRQARLEQTERVMLRRELLKRLKKENIAWKRTG